MSKIGKSLLKGAKEALAHARGEKVKIKVHKIKVAKAYKNENRVHENQQKAYLVN